MHSKYILNPKPFDRLDMETSGVIMFAKSEVSCAELGRQFREREVSLIFYF
jgi:23S rRNA-/tRNA-specific pseudouridylate synthase